MNSRKYRNKSKNTKNNKSRTTRRKKTYGGSSFGSRIGSRFINSAIGIGDITKKIETGMSKGATSFASGALNKRKQFSEAIDGVPALKVTNSVLSQITSPILFVVGNILGFPFQHINQIIPDNVCRDMRMNPATCNQKISEYLFTGTKEDLGKVLDETDKDDCLTLDDMNQIIKCKHRKKERVKEGPQTIETQNQHGGSGRGNVKKYKEFKIACSEAEEPDEKSKQKFGFIPGQPQTEGNFVTETILPHQPTIKENKKFFRREENLNNIRRHLLKVNLLLRKYQCPKVKLKTILKKVKNKELLIKIKDIFITLMIGIPPTEYTKSKNAAESLIARKKCDQIYNDRFNEDKGYEKEFQLKIIPDSTHMTFSTDLYNLATDTESCPICTPWGTLSDKYFQLVNDTMFGNKKTIYVLVNFLHDILVVKRYEMPQNSIEEDQIFEDIKHILHNIQCRSDVIGILDELIANL
jgi:hypothetical protein